MSAIVLLTTAQVLERLQISRTKLYLLERDGDAPQSIKLGRKKLFPEQTLEEWVAKKLHSHGANE